VEEIEMSSGPIVRHVIAALSSYADVDLAMLDADGDHSYPGESLQR